MMRYVKIILCIGMIFFVPILSGCGNAVKGAITSAGKSVSKGVSKAVEKTPNVVKRNADDIADLALDAASSAPATTSTNRPAVSKPSTATKAGAVMMGGAAVANEVFSEDKHWIKDGNNGAYLWNPEPQDGESVRWSGDVVREGNNLYAQGRGTVTWYKNGQVVQTDEGSFERGKHHGKFKHTFKNGNVAYSNWDHGAEIPLEKNEQSPDKTLNINDLSLGSLSIDDRVEKVSSVLGKPNSSTVESDGSTHLKFKDVNITIRNGKISTLVSMSPALATPRGIREGSSLQDVLEVYGTNYTKTPYEGQMLYEYVIKSAEGNSCYLRFAVNNSDNKVAYISERFVK